MKNLKDLKEYVYPNGTYKNTRSNSRLIKKYFPEIYEQIKDDYKTNLYMILHKINEIPQCKNPNCHNKVKLKSIGEGFRFFCSNRCIAEFQKTDNKFKEKIKNTKRKKAKKYLKEKYPDLNLYYDKDNKNYLILKNYCKHGDVRIYSNTFNKLYSQNKNLCIKCNEEFLDNYIPNEKEINLFQENFEEFYNQNSSSFNHSWFLLNYPIEYKIILYWSNHLKNILLSERIYLFRNKLKDSPKCNNPKCNNKTRFNPSQLKYTNFCNSPACVKNVSTKELKVYNFLKEYSDDIKLKYYIGNNEFDMIIPSKNLLVEFNELYWHGELVQENKNYHYNKFKLAKENNFKLFNIWEDDWNYKKDIIKSMLLNKIGKSENIIYARKCEIKEIKSTKEFLNKNHLQGWCQSSVNLGLYYKNELVSMMTFGRRNISKLKTEYELLRFCNKLNTSVIGGASRLFKYFINNYSDDIISFASCDYSDGELYEKLGFRLISYSGINYWWSNNDEKFHRSKFMKYKLVLEGADPNKTEAEIMQEKGYYRIWGTGNLKYEYIKKEIE